VRNFELISFASADKLVQAAAGAWLDEIESASRAGKSYCVALSGGRIAQKFFAAVVEQTKTRKIGDGNMPSFPTNAHFFWADERCVPPDDRESNFYLATEFLFMPLKISEDRIHRIRGEDSPEVAVKTAGSELRRIVPPDGNGQPVLDLIFLGMGEDGHVASLFPNASAEMANNARPFLAVENSPKPPLKRISMSYAVIAAAKNVWVLASGAGKEAALRESLELNGHTPLAQVIRSRSHTRVFADIQPG
jgi:6-phosphogluconolactonase